MSTNELRQMASNTLDGFKVNRDKLAKACISLCDLHERLQAGYNALQGEATALRQELEAIKRGARPKSTSADLPPGFGDIFGNAFNKTAGCAGGCSTGKAAS